MTNSLSSSDFSRVSAAIAAEVEARKSLRFLRYFPDEGPLRRELYPKHIAFFDAGRVHRERAFIAANRVGKTECGAFEATAHLTGLYPAWWTGRKFSKAVRMWAAGDTGKTVRDIIQVALYGPLKKPGTGMLPRHLIAGTTRKAGIEDALETIYVRHVSGELSTCVLKSYDQRREAFQGTSIEVGWLDEEPPSDIYTETLLRTMDTPDLPGGGVVMLTFTPLMGLSEVVLSFLPGGGSAPDGRVVS